MKGTTRRKFLKGAAAAGAAGMLSAYSYSRVLGANDTIGIAIVGFRGQGGSHLKTHLSDGFKKMGVRVVALCDADRNVLEGGVKQCDKAGAKVKAVQDYRRILDMKDVDAVVTATPNHWHALVTIWACQAGKDVYVEKPVSHNIWEGRKAVEAARRHNRIVMAGTQNRSDTALAEAVEWIQAGNLGAGLCARGLCYKRRGSIGKVSAPTPIPDHIDYDLWCGPAEKKPLMRKRLHYDWHWVWNTGNGDVGNQGIHQMDVCRWFLGEPALAPRVMSIGGRFGYDDDGETANTQITFLDYKPTPLIFEVRGLPRKKGDGAMPNYKGSRIGEVIECEGGYLCGGYAYDKDGKKIKQFKREGGGKHRANFIKVLRSRKMEDNPADILEGHISSALCHLGNISHLLGKKTATEEIAERIKGNKLATESWERFQQHLDANEVDLKKTKATLGPWLEFDPKTERFTGPMAAEANKLATRVYRKPFVVPAKV